MSITRVALALKTRGNLTARLRSQQLPVQPHDLLVQCVAELLSVTRRQNRLAESNSRANHFLLQQIPNVRQQSHGAPPADFLARVPSSSS